MTAPVPVCFFLPEGGIAFSEYLALDPDRDFKYFSTGVPTWTVQTFLRLKRKGMAVQLSSGPIGRGIVFVHRDVFPELMDALAPGADVHIVCIRADRGGNLFANTEIVQNQYSSDGRRRIYMPHWPQAGLIPRDRSRAHRIENVAMKSIRGQVHEALGSAAWKDELARLGVSWVDPVFRKVGIHPHVTFEVSDWHDYRNIDAIIALRPNRRKSWTNKPATKLVNAWRAGCPAILGREVAYRELRQSELDYIEVESPGEAIAALRRLKDDPDLYERMVQNGFRRQHEWSFEAVEVQWTALIGRLSAEFDAPRSRLKRRLYVWMRKIYFFKEFTTLLRQRWKRRRQQLT